MSTISSEIQDISNFFETYVFGFIYHDVEAAIKCKANFLAAMALLTYTEFLGGLQNGNFGVDEKDRLIKKQTRKNFETFFCYLDNGLGTEYQSLLKSTRLDVYRDARCGLVHQYFIKQNATIWTGLRPDSKCGITLREDGHIDFYVEKYFLDFKAAVQKYFDKLVSERDPTLVENFFKARRTYLGHIH